MIDNTLLNMLIDPNPRIRKRGVKMLAKTRSLDALPHLANVYYDDKDSEVRQLAHKAGVYIKKVVNQNSQIDFDELQENEAVKEHFDRAIFWAKQGNNERAATALAQAFEIEPEMEKHPTAIRLAEWMTGLKGAAAIRDVVNFAFGSSYASGHLYSDDETY
jgi:hypothetical protein